jgi:hypothetical protein
MTSVPGTPNPMPVAAMLQQYYRAVLGYLEEWYLKQQHQKQLRSAQAAAEGSNSSLPPGMQAGPSRIVIGSSEGSGHSADVSSAGGKRKMPESSPEKRARLKLRERLSKNMFKRHANVFVLLHHNRRRRCNGVPSAERN